MLIAIIALRRDRGKLINNFHDFTLTHLRTIRSLLDPYPRYPRDAGGHSRRMTRDGDVEGLLPGPASSDVRKETVSYFHTLFLLSHVRVCMYIRFSRSRKERNAKSRILLTARKLSRTTTRSRKIAGIGWVKAESRWTSAERRLPWHRLPR